MRMKTPSFFPTRSGRTQGFTLIELLIVIAIIGILAAILIGFFIRDYRNTQVRDGAIQILTDLRQLRGQAQRTSANTNATVTGTVGSPKATYSFTLGGTTTSRSLSAPIQVAPYTGYGQTVIYSAPYGELSGSGVIWAISSTLTSKVLYVKTVGVTGKVILSATP